MARESTHHRFFGLLTALMVVTGVLATTGAVRSEASVYVRDRPSDKSRFMFTIRGDVVSKMHLISPYRCADGRRGTIGILQGLYEPGTLDLPIRKDGRFSFTQQRAGEPRGSIVKVRARVSRDWVNGRWFMRRYDPWDNQWCWTGKSMKNPWVSCRSFAGRSRAGTRPGIRPDSRGSTATGIRTPVSGLRIRRPRPLDDSGAQRPF